VLLKAIRARNITNIAIVCPDVGSVKLGRAFAKRLDADLAIVDKRRSEKDRTEVVNVIGDVEGRNVIILDDMISSGSTVVEAAKEADRRGARSIIVCATHPVFSGTACERIMDSPIQEVVVTNSIPFDQARCPKVRVEDVSDLLAEAIRRIHGNESVSTLFV